MTRQDQEFQAAYSYWLEQMLNTFWRRIDTIINIVLIVLGTSIAATLHIDVFIGLSVALLAAINVVVQPLRKSINASIQSEKFSDILNRMDKLNDHDLDAAISSIRETNSDEIGLLTPLAFNQAAIILGLKPNSQYTWANKLTGLFIGNLPHHKN